MAGADAATDYQSLGQGDVEAGGVVARKEKEKFVLNFNHFLLWTILYARPPPTRPVWPRTARQDATSRC